MRKYRQYMENRKHQAINAFELIYTVNYTMGPEYIFPLLLVFGALPRPAWTHPSLTTFYRQRTIEDSRKLFSTKGAKKRLAFALRHPFGAKEKENSQRLLDLPSSSPVLLYLTNSRKWEGPFLYISIEVETVVVQLNKGRIIFHSICVRPWIRPMTDPTIDRTPADDCEKGSDDTPEEERIV